MNGILIIDKEKEYTSRDVVNIVGKLFNTKKVGHAGTLDPLATGVLVIALGRATKIIEFLTNDDKEYIAQVVCGFKTDTFDVTGKKLEENYDFVLTKEKVENVLKSMLGKYKQEVPKYSAIKVNGKRLYEYARENKEVKLPIKEVEIKDINLLDIDSNRFTFIVKVSKGTYIRSLIRDIGEKLNILCTMENLRRTREGIFNIEEANTLEDIKNDKYKLISIKDALSNYLEINIDDDVLYKKISNGAKLIDKWNVSDICVFIYKDRVIGIYEKKDDILKVKKIFD